MAKCFITGIELRLGQLFLLDLKAANKAIYNLRRQLKAVEGIVQQLAGRDGREIYNPREQTTFIRHDRRVVCEAIAKLLSESYTEKPLFISWNEYRHSKHNDPQKTITQQKEETK